MKHISSQDFQKAVSILKKGGVIIFPTETSYGIGCDATNDNAVKKLLAIKGRGLEKGLPVLIESLDKMNKCFRFTKTVKELARIFWPGALNIIISRKKECFLSEYCEKDGFQSVRISSHPIATALVHQLGFPIVATSANKSGEKASYKIKEIKKIFKDSEIKPDFYLDFGDLPDNPASTTVKVDGDKITVLRMGVVVIPQEFL